MGILAANSQNLLWYFEIVALTLDACSTLTNLAQSLLKLKT